MIVYLDAQDITDKVKELVMKLELDHVQLDKIACFRSKGSNAKGTIARCHALPKIMQRALKVQPFYVIEVISEEFDKMSEDDKTRTLIHELLHVPHAFGGGFKHHDFVNKAMVEKFYKRYKNLDSEQNTEQTLREKIRKVFGNN